ncbi:hypothetical protein [Serratia sp. 1D1416]|uniref:hypothetical protein n=1 Tax=Serratia sp. 1D1416 TaxID=2447890 RepID=UPI001013C99A|nr:hypothetical protein [Serratia sp. 1D1416]
MAITTEALAKIKAGIARRKAMPKFGESVEGNIQRLRTICETQESFSGETVEMLVNALEEALAARDAVPEVKP